MSPLPASATIASGPSSTAAQYESGCIGVSPRLPDAQRTEVSVLLTAERPAVVGPLDRAAGGGEIVARDARRVGVDRAVGDDHAVGLPRRGGGHLAIDDVAEDEVGVALQRIAAPAAAGRPQPQLVAGVEQQLRLGREPLLGAVGADEERAR